MQNAPVALISMPTLAPEHPSFQLALLKPTLERQGIAVEPRSLFLDFARHAGFRVNAALADVRPCMVGEWLFARAAFGAFSDDAAYFERYERDLGAVLARAGCTRADLLDLRDRGVESFLDAAVARIPWERYGLIGFSVVFQQMTASLALARRLKERHPRIPIILGGGGLEDDIADEVMRGCPWIDFVHLGDADLSFPEMVRRLYGGASMAGLPGLLWREGGEVRSNGRAPNLLDLRATPTPDFDEYFEARRASGYDAFPARSAAALPIETGRGCWWGMKNHCTFCGLNRAGMEFRAKDPDDAFQMIRDLARRYGARHFNAIDNIMAPEYLERLFGRLAAEHTDLTFFFEVRPSYSRQQLGDLRRGGLAAVQPGIESFSTHILQLMRKHSAAVNNLAFLKWSTYYGIKSFYNLLLGFPGETAEDYRVQCDLIARIPHLQPPSSIHDVRPDRGSPMYVEPDRVGIANLRPEPSYAHIFPPERFDLRRVSFYFTCDKRDVVGAEGYREIRAAVGDWQRRHRQGPRPFLRYTKACDTLTIEDGRNGSPKRVAIYDRAARLYEMCGSPQTRAAIDERFRAEGDLGWVDDALRRFIDHDLLVHLDNRYLSLALPANPYH